MNYFILLYFVYNDIIKYGIKLFRYVFLIGTVPMEHQKKKTYAIFCCSFL